MCVIYSCLSLNRMYINVPQVWNVYLKLPQPYLPASEVSALHNVSCTQLPLIFVLLSSFLQIMHNFGRIVVAGPFGTVLRRKGFLILGIGGGMSSSSDSWVNFLFLSNVFLSYKAKIKHVNNYYYEFDVLKPKTFICSFKIPKLKMTKAWHNSTENSNFYHKTKSEFIHTHSSIIII